MLTSYICPKVRSFLAVLSFLSVAGCSNVRLAQCVQEAPLTIAVPYVRGDKDGSFTSALVEAVHCQPGLSVSEEGQYQLVVALLDDKEEKIGFRYQPRKLKAGKKDLILSETRAKALAEVTVRNRHTGETVAGPAYILGSSEYDHQDNTIDNDINALSLGQLSDVDTAQDVTHISLDRDLSRKIALWLQNQQDLRVASSQTR